MLSALAKRLCRDHQEYDQFAAALREAAGRRLPLAVKLSPPGHVDFGYHTVFPHCPRCKAEAPLGRWKSPYGETPIDCPVCGFRYSPAATHVCEREFWSATVKCERCGRSFVVRDFSEAERELLEEQASLKDLLEELQWLDRVRDFYKRHPDRTSQSDKARSDKRRGAKLTLEDIYLAEPLKKNDRKWSAEDLEVIEYLKYHSFNLDARYSFVRDQVQAGADTVLNKQVSCPDCGGCVG